jgi:hypothetical protein
MLLLINTNSHQIRHQLINYLYLKEKEKKTNFRVSKLDKKWIHTEESYCNLHNVHTVTTAQLKRAVFCAREQILTNYTKVSRF